MKLIFITMLFLLGACDSKSTVNGIWQELETEQKADAGEGIRIKINKIEGPDFRIYDSANRKWITNLNGRWKRPPFEMRWNVESENYVINWGSTAIAKISKQGKSLVLQEVGIEGNRLYRKVN